MAGLLRHVVVDHLSSVSTSVTTSCSNCPTGTLSPSKLRWLFASSTVGPHGDHLLARLALMKYIGQKVPSKQSSCTRKIAWAKLFTERKQVDVNHPHPTKAVEVDKAREKHVRLLSPRPKNPSSCTAVNNSIGVSLAGKFCNITCRTEDLSTNL